MSISRRHLFCIILLYISTDSLHAKQHSVYVQNYHQEFDYANADRIPSPSSSSFQKEDDIRSTSNEDLENFQSTTLPTAEFLSDISANDAPSTITPVHDSRIGTDLISTSEKAILPHKSTNSPHNMSLPSTKNEYYDFDYREPTPPHEHVNQT
ncbi:unnamed protein product, partial [Rotaria magnacalcarata]